MILWALIGGSPVRGLGAEGGTNGPAKADSGKKTREERAAEKAAEKERKKRADQEAKEKKGKGKVASTLRLHVEREPQPGLSSTSKVRVLRSSPVDVSVESDPFFNEGDIQLARVIDTGDGSFLIGVQATTQGQLRLEMGTATARGKRIAVWARWTEGRWLAAPKLAKPISDGVFVFTPDCTREEAERIVNGLNNVAIELKNQDKPGKKPAKSSTSKDQQFPGK